jgi:hypothetical protein
MKAYHGKPMGDDYAPKTRFVQSGMFGRMFPGLAVLDAPDDALIALGQAMKDQASNASGDNKKVPAGFTYLGQFIDHDMTFDTTPIPERTIDPMRVHNFRTPKLDLDCLYGLGPAGHPFMYQRSESGAGPLFLIGQNRESRDQNGKTIPSRENDLPRHDRNGFAMIGDPRNDENLIVAQLHLAFLKFHNKIVERLRDTGLENAKLFAEARKKVTWHYQWIVLHDFVRRIVDSAILDDVLQNGRRFYKFGDDPFIPIEFSVAAYRLGHSMVREDYDYNRVFGPGPGRLANATLSVLFAFTGFSGRDIAGSIQEMPVPTNWIIDWRRFFDLPRSSATGPVLNLSRKLDPLLTAALHALPGSDAQQPKPTDSLAVRNLLRGQRMQLPSGQSVAAKMRIRPLSPAEVSSGPDGVIAKGQRLECQTPLWYYILKEAQVKGRSEQLGPVGSRIVSEVFVGILQGDSNSFLAQNPAWTPDLPAANPGTFTMADLLTFVGEVNPIGD